MFPMIQLQVNIRVFQTFRLPFGRLYAQQGYKEDPTACELKLEIAKTPINNNNNYYYSNNNNYYHNYNNKRNTAFCPGGVVKWYRQQF
jgi:hypothetical protein